VGHGVGFLSWFGRPQGGANRSRDGSRGPRCEDGDKKHCSRGNLGKTEQAGGVSVDWFGGDKTTGAKVPEKGLPSASGDDPEQKSGKGKVFKTLKQAHKRTPEWGGGCLGKLQGTHRVGGEGRNFGGGKAVKRKHGTGRGIAAANKKPMWGGVGKRRKRAPKHHTRPQRLKGGDVGGR